MAKQPRKSSTSLPVQPGEIWAVPAPGVGYFPLVIARTPAPDSPAPFVFAYLSLECCKTPADAAKVPRLVVWDRAWIGRISLRPFNTKRWKHVGSIKKFDAAAWPVVPVGNVDRDIESIADDPSLAPLDLCSIETTSDKPTNTVLDNTGVHRALAEMFPKVITLSQPSALESALVKWARNRNPNFWDLHLELTPITHRLIPRWMKWANEARARCADRTDPAIPAGAATDKGIKPGDWLSFPLAGGGFGVALVVQRKAGVVIFGDAMLYAFPNVFEYYPSLDQVSGLTPDDACFVGGTSLAVVGDGRWRVIGSQPNFKEADWVVPYLWHQTTEQKGKGVIGLDIHSPSPKLVRVHESILALEPLAGIVANTNHGPLGIEWTIGCRAHVADQSKLPKHLQEDLVTPARIAVWRKINCAIDEARR